MKISSLCLTTGLMFGLSFAASAQQGTPSDIKYCNALGKAYSGMFPTQEGMPASDVMTLSRCETDTRSTIATLEKKLRDQKADLPQHEGVAQPPGSTGNPQ